MRTFALVVSILLCFSANAALAEDRPEANYMPKGGYVPSAEVAIAIAVAVWIPIYGEKTIMSEKPFSAELKNGIWHVQGTLPKEFDFGGTAIAEISKLDGKILRVIHYE